MALLGLDLPVPDHTTLSRRGETLAMPRRRPGRRPVHRKRGDETRLSGRVVNVLGLAEARSFGPTLWLTLAMTRRKAAIGG